MASFIPIFRQINHVSHTTFTNQLLCSYDTNCSKHPSKVCVCVCGGGGEGAILHRVTRAWLMNIRSASASGVHQHGLGTKGTLYQLQERANHAPVRRSTDTRSGTERLLRVARHARHTARRRLARGDRHRVDQVQGHHSGHDQGLPEFKALRERGEPNTL